MSRADTSSNSGDQQEPQAAAPRAGECTRPPLEGVGPGARFWRFRMALESAKAAVWVAWELFKEHS